MEPFQYTALPARVLFGFGTIANVADELAALGRKRAFVISDPHHARRASHLRPVTGRDAASSPVSR